MASLVINKHVFVTSWVSVGKSENVAFLRLFLLEFLSKVSWVVIWKLHSLLDTPCTHVPLVSSIGFDSTETRQTIRILKLYIVYSAIEAVYPS